MKRREFLRMAAVGTVATGLSHSQGIAQDQARVPSYLSDYAREYRLDPKAAAVRWFREARFGLFMHYGLYSLVGLGEWVQYQQKIPVAEYAKLQARFTAARFDVDMITDMALDAGMKYVNLTARHHDSFSLFRTSQSSFNSVESPSRRDLVGELAEVCGKKGLGLFLYYSYAADWKHPYFYSLAAAARGPVDWRSARPQYDDPQPEYVFEEGSDFKKYISFVHAQLRELLTNYGPLAGIWLDPIMGYYSRPDLFPIEKTYSLIRSLQPQVLISFKQGANGDEDFLAPERNPRAHTRGGEVGRIAWERNQGKPIEICDTLQPRTWGYDMRAGGKHKRADEVADMLSHARSLGANLLLNTGPLPDGQIDPVDAATLREVGRKIRAGEIKL